MPHSYADRLRIHRKAKKLVRLKTKQDAQDRYTFMQQCISQMIEDGEAEDREDAALICQLLYDELEALDEE